MTVSQGMWRRYTVRPATASDMDSLARLGAQMHQETSYRNIPYNERNVAEYISFVIANPNSHCLLVAEENGNVIGFIGGYLDRYIFSDECMAFDTVFYVDQSRRGTWAAKLLIDEFVNWARKRNVWEICLGTSSGINTERVGRFYERLGFTCVGSIYKLSLR